MITGMEVRGDVNKTGTVGLVDGGDFSDVAVVGADGVGIGDFLPFLYPSLSLKRGGVSLLDEESFVRQRAIGRLGRSVVAIKLTAVEDSPKVAVVKFFVKLGTKKLVIDGSRQWDHKVGGFG